MDLSIEAIEADLTRAEQNAGKPTMALHLTTAQIRATLRSEPQQLEPAVGYVSETSSLDVRVVEEETRTTYVVPSNAEYADRLEVAARILGTSTDDLDLRLSSEIVHPEPIPVVIEADQPEDEDDDFFAEAKRERKK